jgi:hypothetical protein
MIAVISVGLAIPSTSAAPARPADASQVSPSTLVKEWIAALDPVNQDLPKIEAALKALPITATDAQIARVVAPVAGLIKPIEALVPRPVVKTTSTSLEALGSPNLTTSGCSGGRYASVSQGARLVMGGKIYGHGFQVHTSPGGGCIDHWTWNIGGKYQTFTALVGLDESETTPTGSVSFMGPNGTPLPFTANGEMLFKLKILSDMPTLVNMSIIGDQKFVFVTTTNGNSGTIDFANDGLTSS